MSLSKRLSIPLILSLAALVVHTYWFDNPQHSIWLLLPVILLAVLYMMHPDIDRWWMEKNPQQIPDGMRQFLDHHLPSFDHLSPSKKINVLQLVGRKMFEIEYHPQGFDDVPQQLQGAVAGHLALLECLRPSDQAKLRKIEKIALYRHPFPSPQFPDHLHASELFWEDGIALFCATHAVEGYRTPVQYPNLILYEFAKAVSWKQELDFSLSDLEAVSGFSTDKIINHIGLPEEHLDVKALAICYYLCYPDSFAKVLPKTASFLKTFLQFG